MSRNTLRGRAWKFGDSVDTDVIIPYKYKARTIDPKELGEHCMEGLDPDFSKKIRKGDFILAGRNFGCGSSREQAPVAIAACGISAVLAESFARIFYRNAINIGLPVMVSADISKEVEQGDELEVDLEKGEVRNLTKGRALKSDRLPGFLEEIARAGGLIEYYKAHGRFPWG